MGVGGSRLGDGARTCQQKSKKVLPKKKVLEGDVVGMGIGIGVGIRLGVKEWHKLKQTAESKQARP